jgi:hypothetical protein
MLTLFDLWTVRARLDIIYNGIISRAHCLTCFLTARMQYTIIKGGGGGNTFPFIRFYSLPLPSFIELFSLLPSRRFAALRPLL